MALIPSAPKFTNPAGANQFLGDDANKHDGQVPFVGGIVGLNLITDHDVPFGAPTKGQPLGRQNL